MASVIQTEPKKKRRKRGAVVVPDKINVADIQLPKKKSEPSTELFEYSMLLYSPPKFGKTTAFESFPDSMYLRTESGTKGLRVFDFNRENGGVTSWAILLRAVDLLERTTDHPCVVIDRIEEAYRLCLEHVCATKHIEHPNDANDYGKTWAKILNEFRNVLLRLEQTGRGIFLTSHRKFTTVDRASGGGYTTIGPSISGRAADLILGFVDFIWYGEIVEGQRRLIITDGDDLYLAGSRKHGLTNPIPRAFLLPEDEGKDYETFVAAFRGELDGAQAREIMASRGAHTAVKAALDAARAASLKDEEGGGS